MTVISLGLVSIEKVKFVTNTPRVFSTLSTVFGRVVKHDLPCLIYYVSNTCTTSPTVITMVTHLTSPCFELSNPLIYGRTMNPKIQLSVSEK